MVGSAALSPKARKVSDIEERVLRLADYEKWRQPRKMGFPSIVGPELWKRHRQNWEGVLAMLKSSQVLADEIRIPVKKQV